MKALFREYFYVPKDGKIKDQVMMAHVIFTTVFILLCLLAIIVTAYSHAMFNLEVEAKENVIMSASFEAEFYVERTSLTLIEPEEELIDEEPDDLEFVEVENNVYEVTFDTVGSYFVTVTALGTAQNGFCVFEVVCDDPAYDAVYYTPSLSAYGGALSEMQFYFDVTTPATVTATSYLGTIFDYEKFENIDMTLIFDGDAIPIGEPIVIPEEDMIDDPELLEELFGEDVFLDDESEEGADSFGGSGGGYASSDEDSENEEESSSDDRDLSDDSGSDSTGDSDSASSGSDSGSGSGSASSGSDSGSGSGSASSGSDSGSDSGSSSSGSDSGSDSGSASSGSSSGGDGGSASSGSSSGGDSGSSSSGSSSGGDSGSSSSGSSSGGDGGSASSGGSSGGGDSAPAGE